MNPVPHTKLKGDLQLELRAVKEEIAKEKTKLEVIQNQRVDAEAGFRARELQIKTLEQQWKDSEENRRKIDDDYDRDIRRSADIISSQNREIEQRKKNLSDLNAECANSIVAAEASFRIYEDAMRSRRLSMDKMDNEIATRSNTLDFMSKHMIWLGRQTFRVKYLLSESMKEYQTKNKSLEERERKVVVLEKDIAVMSSRLVERYHAYEPNTKIEKLLSI